MMAEKTLAFVNISFLKNFNCIQFNIYLYICIYIKINSIETKSGQTFKEVLIPTSKSLKPHLMVLSSEFFLEIT